MRLQFTTRTLLLTILGLSVACALIAWINRVRMTHNIVSESNWPSELRKLLAELECDSVPIQKVEVRSVGFVTTYCWTMPATDRTIAAHVSRFHLTSVSSNGVEAKRIQDRFPSAWSWPDHQNIECFAFPVGLPGADDGEFEFVLLHDKTAERLFFYYYLNF